MKKITELLKEKRIYFDGGTGTLLQAMGLKSGEPPEMWNLEHPERIVALHRAYFEAGCNIVKANTFGINRDKYADYEGMIRAAVKCAKEASQGFDDAYVALDIGPTGQLLEPLGPLPFESAVSLFYDTIKAAEGTGVDLILIETMNDAYETKAAVLAAKEACNLPIFVTNAYDSTGKLMTGASPSAMITLLEGLGVDALGMNCSFGPDKMLDIIGEFERYASVPVIVNPNAGLPSIVNGRTVFDISADEFGKIMVDIAKSGGCILGGCCGTTPEHMKRMIELTQDLPYKLPEDKDYTFVSSYTHAVEIDTEPVLIGERINPTGKSRLKEALRSRDLSYILNEGIKQAESGAHILDVNVGLPEIDEINMMEDVVKALQSVTDLPLQIDTSNPRALEAGVRIYNGKPLINSVSGTEASMKSVFPIVQKYGGCVIALTIGEEGIPETSEGRVEVALKIIDRAAEYGIEKKDIIVDPLAMTVSSNPESARITLEAIRQLKDRGIKTSLGVSNISFGLPNRENITSVFFAQALETGLNCAIMNPFSQSMMNVYYAYRALNSMDLGCADYIRYSEQNPIRLSGKEGVIHNQNSKNCTASSAKNSRDEKSLKTCIIKGLKADSVKEAEELLLTENPLDIIDKFIVPALNEIGADFEAQKAYLPQLLMSAEAAAATFEIIKKKLPQSDMDNEKSIVLATVKGDIHDIGKNIVKVLLQSYGFNVIDLGRDVTPEAICESVVKNDCGVVGLSALMTTTVPSMSDTIKLLRESGKTVKVVVGGAVLTQEYADKIGADFYAADAMDTVKFMEEYYG